MYKNSLALRTNGSWLLTSSKTSPAKCERSCPGWLKWNPLGLSRTVLLTYCLCSAILALNDLWVSPTYSHFGKTYSQLSYTSSNIRRFEFCMLQNLQQIYIQIFIHWLWATPNIFRYSFIDFELPRIYSDIHLVTWGLREHVRKFIRNSSEIFYYKYFEND